MTSQPPSYPGGNDFGNIPPYASGGAPMQQRNGLSTASLVLGIISIPGGIITGGLLGIICGILAIVFGLIGMGQAKRGLSNRRGFAISGLVTGIVGLIVGIGVLIFVIWANAREQACEDRIGHVPSSSELQQCIRDGV